MSTILRLNSRGPDVVVLKSILRSQGFDPGNAGDLFDRQTERAVYEFQAGRVGRNGNFLKPDAIVGPETWWALQNPSGSSQVSGIVAGIPKGLTAERRRLLQMLFREQAKNVREIPDGSNWGDGVSIVLEGVGPAPWCCFDVSYLWKMFSGGWPLGKRHGHVLTFFRAARAAEITVLNPAPGDLFVMLYRDSKNRLTGSGHIGWITSRNDTQFNTIEGNAGNRRKRGLRSFSQPTLEGFIRLLNDDQPDTFERRVFGAEDLSNNTTR